MRSPDSDETGEASGGGDSLAEGFGTFLDGDETSFGDGATQGASDAGALEGLAGTGGTSDAYDVAPDDASSGEGHDDAGDGQGFHEAITGLFDVGVEHEPADAHHDTHDAAAHDDHHDHHDDDGAFDLL